MKPISNIFTHLEENFKFLDDLDDRIFFSLWSDVRFPIWNIVTECCRDNIREDMNERGF